MCMQIFAGFFKRIAQFLCVVTWNRLASERGMASCLGFLPISASSVKTVSELHNFMVMTLHTIGGASAAGRGFVNFRSLTSGQLSTCSATSVLSCRRVATREL